MTNTWTDYLIRPLAKRLHANHKEMLGIRHTMRLAHAYNRFRFRKQEKSRRRLFRDELAELLGENGAATRPEIEMHDGWAIDRSLSLPHLDRVLADSDKIIAERCGVRRSATGTYRSYFQDMWTPDDLERYPSFLDFATSTDVLSSVSHYLQSIPALSATLPSGIRLVESNRAFDDRPDEPHDSQLFHVDYYSLPNVYVLVLLQDTTSENGPWCFLPKSVSQNAASALRNWERGNGYRFTDEEVYAAVNRNDLIEFSGARGTVLFIESSGCFHYGSRNSVKPRFQLMYGYTGACRTDFTEVFMAPKSYPVKPTDSRLRRLVLNKHLVE